MKNVLNKKLSRYVVKSGWMYTVVDTAHPGYVKLGRSNNIPLREKQYNAHSPIPTASVKQLSRRFGDVHAVEARVLASLSNMGILPVRGRLEWFDNEYAPTIIHLIEAEEEAEEAKFKHASNLDKAFREG